MSDTISIRHWRVPSRRYLGCVAGLLSRSRVRVRGPARLVAQLDELGTEKREVASIPRDRPLVFLLHNPRLRLCLLCVPVSWQPASSFVRRLFSKSSNSAD